MFLTFMLVRENDSPNKKYYEAVLSSKKTNSIELKFCQTNFFLRQIFTAVFFRFRVGGRPPKKNENRNGVDRFIIKKFSPNMVC